MDGKSYAFSLEAFSLSGKTAVITGGNQGLGMAYAAALASAGADVFIPHLTEDTEEVRALVEGCGKRIGFSRGDLTDKEYIDRAIADCIRMFGRLDILINNAGMTFFEDFYKYPDEMWEKVMDVNIGAAYYMSRSAAKHMVKNGGKIINIGSALSFTADKRCPPYTVSKHAIIGLTRMLANELGDRNIQTNCIAPGFLATEVNRELRKDAKFCSKITGRIPAGRWGAPRDLMGAAVFLASAASDYINGWTLSVDGGFTTTL